MRQALAALAIFLAMVGNVRADSALQATASRREVANGLRQNGMIRLSPAAEYCWGAFAVLQDFSLMLESIDDPIQRTLNTCVRPKVTRTQLVLVLLNLSSDIHQLGKCGTGSGLRQSPTSAFETSGASEPSASH